MISWLYYMYIWLILLNYWLIVLDDWLIVLQDWLIVLHDWLIVPDDWLIDCTTWLVDCTICSHFQDFNFCLQTLLQNFIKRVKCNEVDITCYLKVFVPGPPLVVLLETVLRIRFILIWIRILGSVSWNNGSCFKSDLKSREYQLLFYFFSIKKNIFFRSMICFVI